jgi:hypothetical protein
MTDLVASEAKSGYLTVEVKTVALWSIIAVAHEPEYSQGWMGFPVQRDPPATQTVCPSVFQI